ncbi:protein KASH5 [Pseudophryne corroboree]|uniref:protein KASH5 n=1 Tax=Pseudophryne corroboree TaxID=495146 RepID=UPI0030817088
MATYRQLDDLRLDFHVWNTDDSSDQDLQLSNGDDSQKHLMQTAYFSCDEQMLDTVFQVCDSEERGKVSVTQIIDYLNSVTDNSRDGNRIQRLRTMLDPDNQGILVDQQTFRTVMAKWISSCFQDRELHEARDDQIFMKDFQQPFTEKQFSSISQLEGYGGHVYKYMGEPTDLVSKITDLTFSNKKLMDQKIKLQRNLELAEETQAILTEEISDLKNKLKSSKQAMHQVQSICNELEDMKTFAKSLEDKMGILCTETKQMQKDTILLFSQKQILQDENNKLLTDKEKVQETLDSLSVEIFKLVQQLCEYENSLLYKDKILAQKSIELEELQGLVEEHKCLLEECKVEKNNLQEQLTQMHEDLAIHAHLSQNQCSSIPSVQSVCKELEEIQTWRQNPTFGPLCGISGYINSLDDNMMVDDILEKAEIMLVQLKQGLDMQLTNLNEISLAAQSVTYLEEKRSILLQSLGYLVQFKCAWETLTSKLHGTSQTSTDNVLSSAPRTRSPIEWSLLPVNNQLTPHHRQNWTCNKILLTGGSISRLNLKGGCSFAQLRTRIGSYITVPRLLLATLLYVFLFFPRWSGEHIWTVMVKTMLPHFKMEHLSLPPI